MQKRISFLKLPICLMICLFSHIYCQSQTFNVTLNTDTIDCELTTIQALTGCNFNGSITVDIDGPNNGVEISNLSLVVDGQFNFDINASATSIDPIQLTFTVVTTDDPTGCSMEGNTSTSTIGLQCNCNGILSVEKTDESCFECNNGTASASIEGLEEPVQYNWSDGQIGHSIFDLSPGIYSLTVTDGDGCEYIQEFEVIKYECSTTFSPEIMIEDISCYESCDGSIEINTTIPGVPSFTVEWEDNTTDPKRTNLCAGSYNATFTLPDFCTYTETYVLDEPLPLQLDTISVQPISPTHSTGVIHVFAQGGTAPIDYILYADGQVHMDSDGIDSMFTELNAGCYEIEAIDANNCSVSIDSICIEDLNTGLKNITILDFKVSPNPTHNLLYLELPNSSIDAYHRFKVINIKGVVVKSGRLHTHTLQLDDLAEGIYTVLIQDDKNLYRARFVKI